MSENVTKTDPKTTRLGTEERQRQLVEACAYLIATRGYSNTSVRDIAAEVGISTGTLLHHFRSKQDLLVATLMAVSEDFLSDINAAAQADLDPPGKLRQLVRALLDKPRHDVGWRVWIAFWHEAATHSELGRSRALAAIRARSSLPRSSRKVAWPEISIPTTQQRAHRSSRP